MAMRDGSGAGGVRGGVVAIAVVALAIAGSWLIPGFAWRGVSAAMGQPPAAVPALADTLVQADTLAQAAAPAAPVSLGTRLAGLLGLVLIVGIGVALSHNRRSIRWRVVAWGLGLQLAFGIFVLRVPAGQALFRGLGDLVGALLHYSYAGSSFVFGELGKPDSSLGVVFALQILPAIIYVSALFAI
ncbi:MAG: Na+ dependent nucleoside transporter N-terminal domain-containing protein, partial [Gemmatimonadales bacterium]